MAGELPQGGDVTGMSSPTTAGALSRAMKGTQLPIRWGRVFGVERNHISHFSFRLDLFLGDKSQPLPFA